MNELTERAARWVSRGIITRDQADRIIQTEMEENTSGGGGRI